MNDTRIKLSRKFKNRWRYHDSKMVHMFVHLLLNANYEEWRFMWQKVLRWQLIRSYKTLWNETGLSIQSVRTVLKKLEKTWEITRTSTGLRQTITIVKYCDYQDWENKANRVVTDFQQTSNRLVTTNKEVKKKRRKEDRDTGTPTKKIWSFFFCSELERKTVCDAYGEHNTSDMVENYNEYITNAKNWKNFKSPYLAIRKRLKRAKDEWKLKKSPTWSLPPVQETHIQMTPEQRKVSLARLQASKEKLLTK